MLNKSSNVQIGRRKTFKELIQDLEKRGENSSVEENRIYRNGLSAIQNNQSDVKKKRHLLTINLSHSQI
jgi:hypothetical protein